MTCKLCGFCCNTMVVKAMTEEDAKIGSFRKNFIKAVRYRGEMYSVFKSECRYLVNGRCRIYRNRPDICKEFPVDKELWGAINPKCGMIGKKNISI